MEPARAADVAHKSPCTYFSLLDIYLLNMERINTCMRGQLVWKIETALSGRGRVEILLPSVFFSFTSSTQGTQYSPAPLMGCSHIVVLFSLLFHFDPFGLFTQLSAMSVWIWPNQEWRPNNTKAVSKPVSGTNGHLRAQKPGFLLLMLWRRMWKATFASERDYGLIHLDLSHECRGGSSSSTQAFCI